MEQTHVRFLLAAHVFLCHHVSPHRKVSDSQQDSHQCNVRPSHMLCKHIPLAVFVHLYHPLHLLWGSHGRDGRAEGRLYVRSSPRGRGIAHGIAYLANITFRWFGAFWAIVNEMLTEDFLNNGVILVLETKVTYLRRFASSAFISRGWFPRFTLSYHREHENRTLPVFANVQSTH